MEQMALDELLYILNGGIFVMLENEEEEPVMCSKCNVVFPTEREYLQHYSEMHKPEESA
jgi:hypothetical protein